MEAGAWRLTPALFPLAPGAWRLKPVLLPLPHRHHHFELLAAQAAHGLGGDAGFEFEQGLVHPAQVLHVEGAVVDPLAGLGATAPGRPEETVEQMGHGPLAPAKAREERRGLGPEEGAAQGFDVEFGAGEAVDEHAKQGPEPVF
ncbi:MAG: hypothetical protein AB1578_23335 [Thermodesulfobacteriota bacterium]